MSDRPPPKRDVFMELVQSESLYLHVDARPLDVVVPLPFKLKPQLVLQVGLNMPVPIPDLQGDDWGVTATLSFSRQPFTCRLPWHAIYAMVSTDGRGMVWPNDVPDEVAAQMGVRKDPPPAPAPAQVEAPAAPKAEEAKADKAEKPKKRKSKKKKAEELPPNVVSLKDHTPPPPPAAAPAVSGEPPPPAPAAKPQKKPAAAAQKKKRELPSYLRVVK